MNPIPSQPHTDMHLPAFLSPGAPDLILFLGGILAMFFIGVVIDVVMFALAYAKPDRWTGGIASLTSPPWTLRDAAVVTLYVVAAFCIAQAAAQAVLLFRPASPRSFLLHLTLVWSAAFQAGALLIAWRLARRHSADPRSVFCRRRWAAWRLGAAGVVSYAAVLPPVLLAALFSYLLLSAVGYDVRRHQQDAIKIFADPSVPEQVKWGLGILAVAVAPVGEELIFRGVLLPAVARRAGIAAGIAATSILFAMVHLNIPSFVPLAVLGAALAASYIYSGNIGVPIALHACFNAASIGLVFVREHLRAHGVPM